MVTNKSSFMYVLTIIHLTIWCCSDDSKSELSSRSSAKIINIAPSTVKTNFETSTVKTQVESPDKNLSQALGVVSTRTQIDSLSTTVSQQSQAIIIKKFLPPVPNIPMVEQDTLALSQKDFNAFVAAEILTPSEKLQANYESTSTDDDVYVDTILASSSIRGNKHARSKILKKRLDQYKNILKQKEEIVSITKDNNGQDLEIAYDDMETTIYQLAKSSYDLSSQPTSFTNSFQDTTVSPQVLANLISDILDSQSVSAVHMESKKFLKNLGLIETLFSQKVEVLTVDDTLSRLQDSLKVYHSVKSSPKYISGNDSNNAFYGLFMLARENIKTILEPMINEIDNIAEFGSSPLVGENDQIIACDSSSDVKYSPTGLMKLADWPLKKSTPCVLGQGTRGVCTAFTTTSALQMAAILQYGVNRPLSQQGLYFLAKMIWNEKPYSGYTRDGYDNIKYLEYMSAMLKNINPSGVYWVPYEEDWAFNKNSAKNGKLDCVKTPAIKPSIGPNLPDYSYCSLSFSQGGYACVLNTERCGLIAPFSVTKGGIAVEEYHRIKVNGDWRQTYIAVAKIANLLQNKIPVVIGIQSNAAFSKPKNGYVKNPDPNNPEIKGGHAVHLVGYVPYSAQLKAAGVPAPESTFDDPDSDFDEFNFSDNPILHPKYDKSFIHPNGYFIIKNSWGVNAGDGGYFYVDRSFLELYISNAATINRVKIIDNKPGSLTE